MVRICNMTFKVLTAAFVVCLLAGAAEPDDRRPKLKQPSRTFLRPPPKTLLQARSISDSSDSPSIVQRVARWFFTPDEMNEPRPRIQDRKPGHGPPRPPKVLLQYGPPKPPGHYHGPPKSLSLRTIPLKPQGQSPQRAIYVAPSQHGVPSNHGPSILLGNHNSNHGASSIQYGAPQNIYGAPSIQFGPPRPPLSHAPAINLYAPPITSLQRPSVQQPGHNKGRDCNPCNKVPWVPMSRAPAGVSDHILSLVSGNHGSSTGVGYLPAHNSLLQPAGQYGPPAQAPESQYGAPPAPDSQYGAPDQDFPSSHLAPGDQYGPPPIPPLIQAPQETYALPPQQQQLDSHAANLNNPPSLPIVTASFLPLPPDGQQFSDQHLPVPEYLTPPQSAGGNDGFSGHHQDQQVAYSNTGNTGDGGDDIDVVKSINIYTDSQPAAQHSITENFNGEVIKEDHASLHLVPENNFWNQEALVQHPIDQIHIPSGGYEHDSIHPHDNFNPIKIQHQRHNAEGHATSNGLEVVKSVKIADYLSSIEYPPQIIQSPYVDVKPPDTPTESTTANPQNLVYSPTPSPEQFSQNNHHEETGVGSQIIREEFHSGNNFNQHSSNTGNIGNSNYDNSHVKDDLQHHLSPTSYQSDNESNTDSYSNHQNTDQNLSSTNKQVIGDGGNTLDHHEDLNSAGNNFYSGDTIQESHIKHEEHSITQEQQTGILSTSKEQHSPGQQNVLKHHQNEQFNNIQGGQNTNSQTLDQVHVITGGTDSHRGTQSSVVVDIQPSIQTAAQGASLIYQINGLNTQPTLSPFQNTFANTPAQTSVFVSFQHAPQKPFNYPPQLVNQQLPSPAPFQNTFKQNIPPPLPPASFENFQTPSPLYQNGLSVEKPAPYLNPPRHPFKGFNTVTNPPVIDYSSWSPTVDSYSQTTWGSVTTNPPKVTLNHQQNNAAISNSGLVPPPAQYPLHSTGQGQHLHKKTKQIQIIVPYTSSKELMQFTFPSHNQGFSDNSAWAPLSNEDPITNQGRNVPEPLNCTNIITDGTQYPQTSWQEQLQRCNGQVSAPSTIENQDDYHLHQESRRVTSTTSIKGQQSLTGGRIEGKKPLSSKGQAGIGDIQHIFASNIRDLLRGEEEIKPIGETLNISTLQKNIDDWTALEFSKYMNTQRGYVSKEEDKRTTAKFSIGTTLHHLSVPSKKIPDEYLTTTPLTFDDYSQNDNYIAKVVPSIKQDGITEKSSVNVFHDHEASGSDSITAIADAENPNASRSDDHSWKFFESNLVLPEAVTVTTTLAPTTTEEFPEESTTETTEHDPPPPWEKLQVSISPITREKVYVVTPLSTWVSAAPPTTARPPVSAYQALSRFGSFVTTQRAPSTSINDIIPFRNSVQSPASLMFQSPRFLIRPTPRPSLHRLFTVASVEEGPQDHFPGASSTTEEVAEDNIIEDDTYPLIGHAEGASFTALSPSPVNSTAAKTWPGAALFGLTHLPTYTPPNGSRVHTYSGHSKVVTMVTAPTVVTGRRNEAKQTSDFDPAGSASSYRRLRPDKDSYLWKFPELVTGDLDHPEEMAAVQSAAVELAKESRS